MPGRVELEIQSWGKKGMKCNIHTLEIYFERTLILKGQIKKS